MSEEAPRRAPRVVRRRATVQDVATRAGVSISSVSRYLNGRLTLPDQTAQRIEEAVQELGYRPSEMARRMLRGKSELIGFVTTDIAYPFFASIASAAELEARNHGYGLVIFNSGNDIDREISIIAKIRDQLIDGLILMTNHADDDGRLAQAISAAGGVVLTDEDVPAADAPRVFAENTKGARLAIAHLIEMGHRDIAFIGGPEQLLSSRERFQGYYETMREAGLSFRSEWVVCGSYLEEAGATAFRQLWAGPVRPTAIFASADLLAIGVIRAAHAVGVRIPDDVSLVGFDDTTNMDLIAPPLTTLRTSSEAYGKVSVELLLASLSEVYAGPRTQRIGVELVRRNSVLLR